MEADLHEALVAACSTGAIPANLDRTFAKRVRYHLPQYVARDGSLFYKKNVLGGVRILQVPTKLELPAILELFHSSRMSGHFAVKRTLNRLQEAYHWTGMVRDVTDFIHKCPTCQVKKQHPRTLEPRLLTSIPVTEPFARVGMDLMGPFTTTTANHKYVIVASCYLTKWVEVKPLASKDCELIAQFFFDDVMMRHSSPVEILTDNGGEFCNALMDVLALHLHVKHTTTSPIIHNAMALRSASIVLYVR